VKLVILEYLKSGISALCTEDVVTIKHRKESMDCEFCDLSSEYELEMIIGGRPSVVWICGKCPQGKQIMDEIKRQHSNNSVQPRGIK
jgi:hypothetical protein